jgi:hypothetical protein
MQIMNLALYTCSFYLVGNACIEATIFVLVRWTGSFTIAFFSRTGVVVCVSLFGLLWLGSFLLASRIVFSDMWKLLTATKPL